MKRSVLEAKLNDAMRRKHSAMSDERSLTGDINYHDREASRIRKDRQKARAKRDRADAAILTYSALLQKALT